MKKKDIAGEIKKIMVGFLNNPETLEDSEFRSDEIFKLGYKTAVYEIGKEFLLLHEKISE